MENKAEPYKDKFGKSWLVFRDKEGDTRYDLWTTNREKTKPNYTFSIDDQRIYLFIGFEVVLFPNNKWGFGYLTNIFDAERKTQCCEISKEIYDTELEALQNAFLHVIKQRMITVRREEALGLISKIRKQLIPEKLF